MYNDICFPFAKDKTSNLFVHPSDVPNGLNSNCYCFDCKEDLIAVNNPENKKRPHFRHQKLSNCNSNFESFIHLFTKEVFQLHIRFLKLPRVVLNFSDFVKYDDLTFDQENYELIVQDEKNVDFDKVEIEKEFKINHSSIRIDVVAYKNENKFFIEPFYTNPIKEEKLKKLNSIDISTISINLNLFLNKFENAFTLDDFINFLQNDIKSKSWVHLSNSRFINLKNKLETNVNIDDINIKLNQYRSNNDQMVFLLFVLLQKKHINKGIASLS
jgi:competence protein CoiA